MYRSGSTWQYNVTCDLLERMARGIRIGFVEGNGYWSRHLNWRSRSRIFKSHDAHETFASALVGGRALAIYCERDLRDVVFSVMHKWGYTFEEVTATGGMLDRCLRNDQFWRLTPRTLIQRYQTIVANPVKSVSEVASFLGASSKAEDHVAVAEAHDLEKTRAHIESLTNWLVSQGVDLNAPENALRHDPDTLFHWNHVRPSGSGWRDLATPSQRLTLARICGEWLIRHGYESDSSWVDESPRA